jgi:hypothetical protein
VLASTLSALSDRLDSKFLTAYWLPAFVAVLGGFGIFAVIVGGEQIDHWLYNLDSVEQTLGVLLIVLAVTMGAFVLRALSHPIAQLFAGAALPRAVADWSTRGQLRVKHRAASLMRDKPGPEAETLSPQVTEERLNRVFPLDDAETQPTLFGNVLATAAEYPRLTYAMEGFLWWPRLSPLVPVDFQGMLGGTQAPMMGLLNLSVVFAGLAIVGAPVLLLTGHWVAGLVTLGGGLLLVRLCYRAAVSQAAELGSLLRVGFDLYRHEILHQMDLEIPANLAAERRLWLQLSSEMLGLPKDKLSRSSKPPAAPAEGESAE